MFHPFLHTPLFTGKQRISHPTKQKEIDGSALNFEK